MKIRTYLAVSYLVVLLLPAIIAYFFYIAVQYIDEKQGIVDYIEVGNKLESIEERLQDPSLYDIQLLENYKKRFRDLIGKGIEITIYRKDGTVLYTSVPSYPLVLSSISEELLYRDLYQLEVKYEKVYLKKPYISNKQLIGFYEIGVPRTEWVQKVSNHKNIFIGLFFLIVIVLYSVVIMMLRHKLYRPLSLLMRHMTAFANGEASEELHYKTRDEMGDLIHHFEQMKKQIVQADQKLQEEQRAKEIMLASLSHDLKTPLTSLRALTEHMSLDESMSPVEKRQYLAIMLKKFDFMKNMVDDMTTLAVLQSSAVSIHLVEVDGEEFFDMLLSGYEDLFEQRDIVFCKSIHVNGSLFVNEKYMIRLIDNLVSNALRYTSPKGLIGLGAIGPGLELPSWLSSCFREEAALWNQDAAILVVQNEGEAIPDELMEQIFEPFVQADQARMQHEEKSSGLGLSIVKKIVEQHNGTIRLLSDERYGTAIIIALPMKKNEGGI